MMVDSGGFELGRRGGSGLLLVASFLIGCAGGDPETSAEIYCAAMCRRSSECGGLVDSHCATQCEDRVSALSDYRPEYVERVADCIGKIDCSMYFGDGAFEPCWTEAAVDLPPSEETVAFCEGWSQKWFQCASSYFQDECARSWAALAGPALDRVAACEAVSCDELGSCARAAQEVGP